MKKIKKYSSKGDHDTMRPEYDFSHAVRGKTHEAYRAGTIVVFLDADVVEAGADSASINRALRLLDQLASTNATSDTQPEKPPVTSQSVRGARRSKSGRSVRPW